MAEPARLGPLLLGLRRRFALAGLETPDLDARLIVEHFSGTSRADAIARPDVFVAAEAVASIEAAAERRLRREPVHRILGWREFRGLRLGLSPDTLEPRPDTETLVEAVLPSLRALAARKGKLCLLDLGTGTGALALALLTELPEATALATDIAPGALETARRNAGEAGLGARFEARLSDWFAAVPEKFHAILSNPPYISSGELDDLAPEVRGFDPPAALDGGPDGLTAYRTIAAQSAAHLEKDGLVAVEIGSGQEREVTALFRRGGFDVLEQARDLGGHVRALIFGRWKASPQRKKNLGMEGVCR